MWSMSLFSWSHRFHELKVVEEAVEIPQLQAVKKIGVIPETIEIPQSLSDVRGVVQNIGTDSRSSVGSTQQQHNHHRKQQWQQAADRRRREGRGREEKG